jgi:hypothetical protein
MNCHFHEDIVISLRTMRELAKIWESYVQSINDSLEQKILTGVKNEQMSTSLAAIKPRSIYFSFAFTFWDCYWKVRRGRAPIMRNNTSFFLHLTMVPSVLAYTLIQLQAKHFS